MIDKKTAANERFGASGAVPRPKGSGDFQVLCLVSSAVKAPPSPSRHHVSGNAGVTHRTVKCEIEN